jgi:hypothetical protein
MSNTGRATIAVIAKENGWSVYDNYAGPDQGLPLGGEWVAYFRGDEQVLIAWSHSGNASYIGRISANKGPVLASGPTRCSTALRWLESAPAKQLAYQQ